MIQLSLLDAIAEGERLKMEGLTRAVDHAERVVPDWSGMAKEYFKNWIKRFQPGYTFKTEDFRTWSEINGLPIPPSKRSYGIIPLWAAKEGLIKKAGLTSVTLNAKAHGCYCSLWMKI